MLWLCGLYYPTSCYWHLRKNNLESRCGAFNVSAFGCRGFLSSNLDVARIWIRNLDVFSSLGISKLWIYVAPQPRFQWKNLSGIFVKIIKVIQIYATFYSENYTKLSEFMRHFKHIVCIKYIKNVICSMITDLWWRLLEKTP